MAEERLSDLGIIAMNYGESISTDEVRQMKILGDCLLLHYLTDVFW